MKQIAQWLETKGQFPIGCFVGLPRSEFHGSGALFSALKVSTKPNRLPAWDRSRRRTRKRLVSFEVKALTEMGGVDLGIRGRERGLSSLKKKRSEHHLFFYDNI